jgi:hypothetical protein
MHIWRGESCVAVRPRGLPGEESAPPSEGRFADRGVTGMPVLDLVGVSNWSEPRFAVEMWFDGDSIDTDRESC